MSWSGNSYITSPNWAGFSANKKFKNLTVDNINVSSIHGYSAEFNLVDASIVKTDFMFLNDTIMTTINNILYVNNEAVFVPSSFSTIADWAYFPAKSNVIMNLNDITGVKDIYSKTLTASNAVTTSNLNATTISNVTLNNSNINSVFINGRNLNVSTINIRSISSTQISTNVLNAQFADIPFIQTSTLQFTTALGRDVAISSLLAHTSLYVPDAEDNDAGIFFANNFNENIEAQIYGAITTGDNKSTLVLAGANNLGLLATSTIQMLGIRGIEIRTTRSDEDPTTITIDTDALGITAKAIVAIVPEITFSASTINTDAQMSTNIVAGDVLRFNEATLSSIRNINLNLFADSNLNIATLNNNITPSMIHINTDILDISAGQFNTLAFMSVNTIYGQLANFDVGNFNNLNGCNINIDNLNTNNIINSSNIDTATLDVSGNAGINNLTANGLTVNDGADYNTFISFGTSNSGFYGAQYLYDINSLRNLQVEKITVLGGWTGDDVIPPYYNDSIVEIGEDEIRPGQVTINGFNADPLDTGTALTVRGDTQITQNLNVLGLTTLEGIVEALGDLNVDGAFTAQGTVDITGITTATGLVNCLGGLGVEGEANFLGAVTAEAGIGVVGAMGVTGGDITFGSTSNTSNTFTTYYDTIFNNIINSFSFATFHCNITAQKYSIISPYGFNISQSNIIQHWNAGGGYYDYYVAQLSYTDISNNRTRAVASDWSYYPCENLVLDMSGNFITNVGGMSINTLGIKQATSGYINAGIVYEQLPGDEMFWQISKPSLDGTSPQGSEGIYIVTRSTADGSEISHGRIFDDSIYRPEIGSATSTCVGVVGTLNMLSNSISNIPRLDFVNPATETVLRMTYETVTYSNGNSNDVLYLNFQPFAQNDGFLGSKNALLHVGATQYVDQSNSYYCYLQFANNEAEVVVANTSNNFQSNYYVASTWSKYPAIQTVDMASNVISNVGKMYYNSTRQPFIQYGQITTGTTPTTVTLPVPYVNTNYTVQATYAEEPAGGGGGGGTSVYTQNKTTSNFEIHGRHSKLVDWTTFGDNN